MELIKIVISRNGLQKVINATEYSMKDFTYTCNVYNDAGYDVKIKRIIKLSFSNKYSCISIYFHTIYSVTTLIINRNIPNSSVCR